jgi:hypothetical protein
MRIEAKPVETIATPLSADDWWKIAAAAVGLASAIGQAVS